MIIRNGRTRLTAAQRSGVAVFALLLLAVSLSAVSVAVASPPQDPGIASSPPQDPEVASSAAQDPEFASSPIYTWLTEHKAAAYWVAPLLMVVVAILPIPAEIPAAMNGVLFGAVLGVMITWGGAMLGAMLSYELARCFGRKLTRRFVKPEVVARFEGLKYTEAPVLLMLRLTPVVAFTVVNWASGLLQVRRSTFMWTTAVGILPGAIAFTASGSAVAALYRRHPVAATAAVVLVCGALLLRIWWKRRIVPSP